MEPLEWQQLNAECRSLLQAYVFEANETCRRLAEIKSWPGSEPEELFSLMLQREKENRALDLYIASRRRLFEIAHFGSDRRQDNAA